MNVSGRALAMLRSLSAITNRTLQLDGRRASLEHLAYELDLSLRDAFAFAILARRRVLATEKPWTTETWMRAADWVNDRGEEYLPPLPPRAPRRPERLRELIAGFVQERTGTNPFLSAEEVRRLHERWSPAVRARRISGCACCELYRTQGLREATELMEPSREVGEEG